MTKSRDEKLKQLKELRKETDIHILLSELLPEMGLRDVIITHERGGKSEDGKDLICSYQNSADNTKEWWAFVVKKGAIKSNSIVIQDIKAQSEDCFDYEYVNAIKGLRIRINKVKIVTNEHFSNEAERKIREGNFKNANIDFWDAEKLIDLLDEKYPQYWVKGSKTYKKYIEAFDEIIAVDKMSKSLGINNKKMAKILDCAIETKLVERVEKEDGTFQWKPIKTNSIVKLENNSIIVGEPGTGKSTFFKTLAKEIIEQNSIRNDTEFYPIILNFNLLKIAEYDLEQAVKGYFQADWNKEFYIDVQNILNTNSCVIFIDALDELPINSEKEKALHSINDFYAKHPNIKIICSSRPSDFLFYNCKDLGFKYLEIPPLNKSQIQSFLSSYFSDNVAKSKRLLKSLRDTGILDKLPQTPMTIALITIIFDEKEVEIPATITDLYKQFVDLLIGKYTQDNTIDVMEVGVKHRLLCYLAMELHTKLTQSISSSDLRLLLGNYAKDRGQNLDTDKTLQDIITNTGLLFINEKDEVQFKHLSFQEYFTAYEIFHHRSKQRDLFINNFNNPWWQNVALFYAGMTKDSPELIKDILEKSTPANFSEYIFNTVGIGKLMQALYNTPLSDRVKGIDRGLENIDKAIDAVITKDEETNTLWRSFSKYGLMQIFGACFSLNFWSITLVEPLKQLFCQKIEQIEESRTDREQFSFEYKLFLICSILASDDFVSFDEFKQLVDKSKSNDLCLFATIDMHCRRLEQKLAPNDRENITFKSICTKIERRKRSLGDIAPYVNIPINNQIESDDK